jgi:hypothetical protein
MKGMDEGWMRGSMRLRMDAFLFLPPFIYQWRGLGTTTAEVDAGRTSASGPLFIRFFLLPSNISCPIKTALIGEILCIWPSIFLFIKFWAKAKCKGLEKRKRENCQYKKIRSPSQFTSTFLLLWNWMCFDGGVLFWW